MLQGLFAHLNCLLRVGRVILDSIASYAAIIEFFSSAFFSQFSTIRTVPRMSTDG